jgi:hypothetical protein
MYDNNSNSTEPLKQCLLQIPKKKKNNNNTENSNDYDNSQLHSSLVYLSIKNPCKDIIHIGANADKEIDTFSTTRPRLFQKEAEELWENDNTNYKEQQGNLKLVESN